MIFESQERPPTWLFVQRSGAAYFFLQLLVSVSVALFAVGFRPPSLVGGLWRRPQEETMRRGLQAHPVTGDMQ